MERGQQDVSSPLFPQVVFVLCSDTPLFFPAVFGFMQSLLPCLFLFIYFSSVVFSFFFVFVFSNLLYFLPIVSTVAFFSHTLQFSVSFPYGLYFLRLLPGDSFDLRAWCHFI